MNSCNSNIILEPPVNCQSYYPSIKRVRIGYALDGFAKDEVTVILESFDGSYKSCYKMILKGRNFRKMMKRKRPESKKQYTNRISNCINNIFNQQNNIT